VSGGGGTRALGSPAISFSPTHRIKLYCSTKTRPIREILSADIRQTRLLHQNLHPQKDKDPTFDPVRMAEACSFVRWRDFGGITTWQKSYNLPHLHRNG
jgi:hypothetical protein